MIDPELATTKPVPTEDVISTDEEATDDDETPVKQPRQRTTTSSSSPDERLWARISHLSALVGILVPLGGILAPLLIWKSKNGQSFVSHHAKEALNFQICLFFLNLLAWVLTTVFIGFLLLPTFALINIFFTLKAAMAAHDGKKYTYPFICRAIKQ